jgi:hypothetical protein
MLPNKGNILNVNDMGNDSNDNANDDSVDVEFRNPNPQYMNSDYRRWRLSMDTIDIPSCTTRHQMRIQIEKVPSKILKNVQVFYICEHCGKVYWDGSRLERTIYYAISDLF